MSREREGRNEGRGGGEDEGRGWEGRVGLGRDGRRHGFHVPPLSASGDSGHH